MDLACIRAQLPATQRCIYLNTGWAGPSPEVVLEAIQEQLAFENHEGPASLAVLEAQERCFQEAREAVARLLGATPAQICLLQNTTQGINVVLRGLPWRSGDEIVTSTLEHSSGLLPAYFLQKQAGVRVRLLDFQGIEEASLILELVEKAVTPRTRLVVLSHIMYANGLRLPLAEIVQIAHRKGALLLVDGAQSAGQIQVEVKALDCDFYAISGQKWLLGPDGVGALYLREDLIPEVQPTFVADSAVYDYDLEGHFTPNAASVRKFELSTRNAALFWGWTAALRFLQGVGLAAIEERSRTLGRQLREGLLTVPGVRLFSPRHPSLASGLVTFTLDGMEPEALNARLWLGHRIAARTLAYPSAVRFSTAFFNTEEELEQTLGAVQSLAATGSRTQG